MPTWKDLWRQRQRWQRGALENIGMYGVTSATARYWLQQLGLGYSFVALSAFFALIIITVLALGKIALFPFWLCVGFIFCVERVTTVWKEGTKARLLAAPLVIELGYDFFLLLVYLKSIADIVLGRQKGWHHLGAAPATAVVTKPRRPS